MTPEDCALVLLKVYSLISFVRTLTGAIPVPVFLFICSLNLVMSRLCGETWSESLLSPLRRLVPQGRVAPLVSVTYYLALLQLGSFLTLMVSQSTTTLCVLCSLNVLLWYLFTDCYGQALGSILVPLSGYVKSLPITKGATAVLTELAIRLRKRYNDSQERSLRKVGKFWIIRYSHLGRQYSMTVPAGGKCASYGERLFLSVGEEVIDITQCPGTPILITDETLRSSGATLLTGDEMKSASED